MKNIAEQVGVIIDNLDKSQDQLEEMAFELLNAVDHVRKHNEEMSNTLDLILETDSEEVTEAAICALKVSVAKISRAIEQLEVFVHKNEEASSERRKYVEEAKQAVDFLRCSIDWDNM